MPKPRRPDDDRPGWHALPPEDVLARLESRAEGLTSEEAARRRDRHGPNEIARRAQEGPLRLLLRQLNDPLIWVLLGSAGVAMVADPADGVKSGLVILAVVVLNTLVGFVQEYKAGQAIAALSGMVPELATTLRDGAKAALPAPDLVPGDVVELAAGDRVPADLRVLAEHNLQVEEAALTGESVPTAKRVAPVAPDAALGDRTSLAFGGTMVTAGTGTGVVVATGQATELGRISTMIDEATALETPLTQALARVGRQLTIAILLVALAVLGIGAAREVIANDVSVLDGIRRTAIFAIALAVGAIPEGLPAIVTIALAIGVRRMAARRAVIRRLPAVETLGSTTVICTDKTGTLTRNEMTVQRLWTPAGEYHVEGVGYRPDGRVLPDADPPPTEDAGRGPALPADACALLAAGVLCSDATLQSEGDAADITGDPTEAALVVAARKAGLPAATLRGERPRVDVVPFESENQYMATLHEADGGRRREVILKGAPEVVLGRCERGLDGRPLDRDAVAAIAERLAGEGLRLLALARKDAPTETSELTPDHLAGGFTLLGLQGMMDPLRPEAIAAIEACHRAGITVKMITGDHKATARAIGAQLGLVREDGAAVSGPELAACDEQGLRETARRANVFARVAPEHKLGLVRALQANGEVVAMTGDGVNDAPALKQSNIGVAMGITGTSVSKEAADVVLTDDNFASIAAAVEEGRRVYDNLLKSLAFVLPTNLGLALILITAVAAFPFEATGELLLPIQATQILWINLIGAVTLALPLAFEPAEPDVMRRPPRRPDEPLLRGDILVRTVIAAVVMTTAGVLLFLWAYDAGQGAGLAPAAARARAQTLAVTTVVFFQVFYMLDCRSLREPAFTRGFFRNRTVFLGIGALALLQAGFLYLPFLQDLFDTWPLTAGELLLAAAGGAVVLPVIAVEEWVRRRGGPAGTPAARDAPEAS
jgi:Ca2+-transporting ATPase